MKNSIKTQILFNYIILVGSILAISADSAKAFPFGGTFTDIPKQCRDFKPRTVMLEEEVGPGRQRVVGDQDAEVNEGVFMGDERINILVERSLVGDCGLTPGGQNDWMITMGNITGRTLYDVFVVSDGPVGLATFANFDGTINGLRAKYITKQWDNNTSVKFILMDSVATRVIFNSLGVPSEGGNVKGSTYSIVARESGSVLAAVPEPTSTLSLLAFGTLGAASALNRKLKPSKSTQKETTRLG